VTILKWILEIYDGAVWTGLIWVRKETNKHGNEGSGSIKCWEILEELRDCWLLKKDSSACCYLIG
jgi:hypothetical protein